MAAQKRNAGNVPAPEELGASSRQMEKLLGLLALIAVRGESQPDKIKMLSGAGFANTEIAKLLGVTANSVNVALHRARAKS